MKRLWHTLVMAFRWLLVPALPVVGLFLGLWLKPAMKPRWEREVGSITRCAGILEDGQNPCLLTYGKRYYENEIQTHQMVAGLSLENGEELFTRKIPARSHDQVLLVPGTTYAVCWRYNPPHDLILYDWKSEAEVHHLESGEQIFRLISVTRKNNTLAVVVSANSNCRITFWHLGTHLVSETVQINDLAVEPVLQLSSSGFWAIQRYTKLVGLATSPSPLQNLVEVQDTNHRGKSQTIASEVAFAHWHETEDSFIALHSATIETKQHWQKYVREDDHFVPTSAALATPGNGIVVPQHPSSYVVLGSSNIMDPLRNRIKAFLGKNAETLVDWIWRETLILDIYRGSTGELVKSVAISDIGSLHLFELLNIGNVITVDPQGEGFVLQKGEQFSYWRFSEFQSFTRWYPWIGLSLGVALSILVARWSLGQASKTMTTESLTTPLRIPLQ